MSKYERRSAIERRVASKTEGLGYWGAKDALVQMDKEKKKDGEPGDSKGE